MQVTKCDRCGSTDSIQYAVVSVPIVDMCGHMAPDMKDQCSTDGRVKVQNIRYELCSKCAVDLGNLLAGWKTENQ